MARIKLLYDDYFLLGASFEGGSFTEEFPLEGVVDPDLGIVARTTDCALESTMFDFSFGQQRTVDVFVMLVANISPGASYLFRLFSDAERTEEIYTSGTRQMPGTTVPSLDLEWEDPNFWTGVNTEGLLTEFKPWIIEVIPETVPRTAVYGRVEVMDTANADGFLDLVIAKCGRCFNPSNNYSYEDNGFLLEPLTDVDDAVDGSENYFERNMRRRFKFSLKSMTWAEGFGEAFRVMVKARTSRHVFVIVDSDDENFVQLRSFLATFTQLTPLQQASWNRSAVTFDLKEVL